VLSLGKTIGKLARYRRQWERLWKAAPSHSLPQSFEPPASRLTEVTGFGPNPGRLRMFKYVPAETESSPALVVVLHGCTQTAASYDYGAGWSTLADRYGFVLLLPQQQPVNNPKCCFNWFRPGDIERDRGEARSIRHMAEAMIRAHDVDRARVFVTGLSAGGAMTSVMLAAYPEVFSGGAIIAGLPYGIATNVQEAFDSMFQGTAHAARELGERVREASPHRGPWPKVSVWHGAADATVKPVNAKQIVEQWADVHGLNPAPALTQMVDGYPRQVWRNTAGEDVIESYTITGMAHGTPLATADGHGAAGAFLLDVGISSSYHIAKFWGLTGHPRAIRAKPPEPASIVPDQPRDVEENAKEEPASAESDPPRILPIDVEAVITKALKAAGLMKSQS
jgi:poly(hydroxyalkanoate) depolymerase family esterase